VGSLFSGYGGLDIAVSQFFDAEVVWHCEWEDAPSKVLQAHWPGVPNYRDVSSVNWGSVSPVDILTGGFPCQDVSHAGRRAGLGSGTRSGLWSEFAKAIDVLRPKMVVIENVRGLLSAKAGSDLEYCAGCMGETGGGANVVLRALGAVLGDLADLGYDAKWCGVRASDVGAPHNRYRIFIYAWDRGGGKRANPNS
jgi:DNA (cytosine-5)-methyltransferase 1